MACKYETSNGRCGLKGCYAYRHKCYTEDMCKCHEPQTNADRIRSMSDEELATMLKDYKDCSKNCIISNGKHCYQICEEESVLLKWLQQPGKENNYG